VHFFDPRSIRLPLVASEGGRKPWWFGEKATDVSLHQILKQVGLLSFMARKLLGLGCHKNAFSTLNYEVSIIVASPQEPRRLQHFCDPSHPPHSFLYSVEGDTQ
jgi:hypothetical protein